MYIPTLKSILVPGTDMVGSPVAHLTFEWKWFISSILMVLTSIICILYKCNYLLLNRHSTLILHLTLKTYFWNIICTFRFCKCTGTWAQSTKEWLGWLELHTRGPWDGDGGMVMGWWWRRMVIVCMVGWWWWADGGNIMS